MMIAVYNYGNDEIRRTFQNSDEATVIYDKAILYPVPDGWEFSTFSRWYWTENYHIPDCIYRNNPDAKVIILRGVRFDRSTKEIWSMLGE